MNKKANSKEKILSLLRARIDYKDSPVTFGAHINDHEIGLLLSELQVFQLELEMQNQELSESHRQLEDERAKFAGFFNLAPVGYFILDQMAIIEEVNQTSADLLQTNKSTILNKRFQNFLEPDNWELFYSFMHRMQNTGVRQSCEIQLLLQDDKEMYTRMEGIAIANAVSGKLQYYLTVIDISESRVAQQKIAETTHRLEMTLAASGTGTWTMEPNYNKLFLDTFSCTILGLNPWVFDGSIKALITLIHPDDQARVSQRLRTALYNQTEVDLEFRILSQNAVKIISIKGKEIENSAGRNYFAGIVMDITERRKLAEQSQNLQNEKQRIIMSAEFSAQEKERYKISSALHDSVCQILYGIKMNLQGLQNACSSQKDLRSVNDLLDQAIRETRELSYELTPSVLRDFGFTAGIKEMAQRFSTGTFKIRTTIKSTADRLNRDLQLYLFRIIQELISNCIKHADASEANIMVCTENEKVVLIVSDNGKGFNKESDQALTEGSGLRSIKNRIYLLGGEMQLQTSDHGTSINIVLENQEQRFTTEVEQKNVKSN